MTGRSRVVGVGMVPFVTPSKTQPYPTLGAQAAIAALADAGIDYGLVQQAFVGYVYGDSTSGQAALYRVGQTGIPIVNVNNNCATGSTALFMARQAVESGAADCVLALGFEQMQRGKLVMHWKDRPSPMGYCAHRDWHDPATTRHGSATCGRSVPTWAIGTTPPEPPLVSARVVAVSMVVVLVM